MFLKLKCAHPLLRSKVHVPTLRKASAPNSRVGVRKVVLIEKVPSQADGSSNPSSKSPEFRCLLCQQKGEWKGQEMIDQRHLATNRDPRKGVKSRNLFVPGYHPCTQFLTSLGGGTPWQEAVSPKNVVPRRIPLIMSTFVAGAGSLKAMGEMQAGPEVESEKASMSVCHTTPGGRLRNRSCLRGLHGLQDCPPSKRLGPT